MSFTVVTYTNTRAPTGFKVLALVFWPAGPSCVRFNGDDAEAVRAAASAWAEKQLADQARPPRKPPVRRKAEGLTPERERQIETAACGPGVEF